MSFLKGGIKVAFLKYFLKCLLCGNGYNKNESGQLGQKATLVYQHMFLEVLMC